MQALIRNGQIVGNDWTVLTELAADAALPAGRVLLPLTAWEARRDGLAGRAPLGVWLDSAEDPARIAQDLARLDVVAINFPVFSDGRGYSSARRLREQYRFQGELRAVGDVLRDQLFYLKRCGFNSFALRQDQDPAACLEAFGDFSETYQAAVDQPLPLFRRRG
mgnify:CR=1 FL=1